MRVTALALHGLPAALAGEPVRDLLAQAQAALADEHLEGALRALARLHSAVVPALDAHLSAAGQAPSSGVGFLGLFQDLPDLDVERESLAALLIEHAARLLEHEDLGEVPAAGSLSSAEGRDPAAQWAWLAERLRAQPLPRSRWWRRLWRSAAGALPDEARLSLQRGAQIVWERVGADAAAAGLDDEAQTELGTLETGDRLTLQVPLTLPGRVAVLAAAGDEHQAELRVVLPQSALEDVPRRVLEVIEVLGELQPVPGAVEQSLIVLWVPELLPAGWAPRVVAQRRLPPGARLRRYRYQVAPPA